MFMLYNANAALIIALIGGTFIIIEIPGDPELAALEDPAGSFNCFAVRSKSQCCPVRAGVCLAYGKLSVHKTSVTAERITKNIEQESGTSKQRE